MPNGTAGTDYQNIVDWSKPKTHPSPFQ
jgi:hypothetical protein